MPAKKKAAVTQPPPSPAPVKAPVTPPPAAEIKLAAAKGRPLLHWIGKKPLRAVTAFPAQHIETFHPAAGPLPDTCGSLYHGDNKEVLAHLLANGLRGQVNLVYIDPPFDSGADYVRKVALRGKGGSTKLDGEAYGLGEQIQYTDIWANDSYLQFMYERLLLLKELMADGASIYLHCDPRRSAFLRVTMDEVFGSDNFQNEIIWERTNAHNMPSKTYFRAHDTILFYSKGSPTTFNEQLVPLSDAQLKRYKPDENGRLYTGQDLTYSSISPDRQFEWRGTKPPPNRSWGFEEKELERLWKEGLILTKQDGTPRLDGLKVYLEDKKGKSLGSIWNDIDRVGNTSDERSDYPTQKPEALLERIIRASSNPGDLILDCFMGSGTTCAVAQKLGRRWIGADINRGALQTAAKRIQKIITEQHTAAEADAGQLIPDETAPPAPASLAFTLHRVNDYDLQIQHNEAVALACEHLGVARTKTDVFFDGTRGKQLVKIVPFQHPLSPADLEQLRDELKTRPDEARDILLVCLGRELACEPWLADWQRLRKRGDVPNKIEVVELRTDPKYGKFIDHRPASARVDIQRKGAELHVVIKDFASPTIIERLNAQAGVLKPQIPDWTVLVDCVMIDPAYDGAVFNVALADVPEKKTNTVQGAYTVPAPAAETTVAVKIIDMLGEEVLVTRAV